MEGNKDLITKEYEPGRADLVREVREIERKGKRFTITRKDPFGFLYISIPNYSGELKPELRGEFTTYDAVEKAITAYFNSRNKSKVLKAKEAANQKIEASQEQTPLEAINKE